MSKKLKEIMKVKKKEDREIKLRKRLKDLGGSLMRLSTNGKFLEEEAIARIINVERSLREENLWAIAFMSAIASVVSASVALIAIIKY